MRILKVEPGERPYEKEIENTLKDVQREVGGLFQPVHIEDGIVLCCNDEGKLNGMEPNRWLNDFDIVCGPFFLVGDDGCGDFVSLTDEQVKACMERFGEPELFSGEEPELEPQAGIYFF